MTILQQPQAEPAPSASTTEPNHFSPTNSTAMVAKDQHSLRNFKLWESYGRGEKALFFGREREIKAIYDKTFASNLLLLYGAGGTGKTSLIRCGLGNRFEDSDWHPIFVRKGENIIKSLSTALRNEADDPEKLRNNSIREKIHQLFLEKFRPIYLVFDQFEELFILGNRQEQDQFFRLLLELLDVNFQCKVILSIKEDYLADLDRYEEAIPALFSNRMRVERMRREQLEEVIRGMARELNIGIGEPEDGPEEQEEIIERIIEKVKEQDTQRVDLGELQFFMDELFATDDAARAGENGPERRICFSRRLVEQTEDIEKVIARRLQEQLEALDQEFSQKSNIKRLPYLVLQTLVTDVETKHTRTAGEIARELLKNRNVAPEPVQDCIGALAQSNILRKLSSKGDQQKCSQLGIRADEKVEIVHDNLAKKLHPLLFNEERHLMKIKAAILSQYEYKQKTGVLLGREGMEYIRPYLKEIEPGLDEPLRKFIADSQREIKKREWKGTMTLLGIIVFLAASAGVALIQWSHSSRLMEVNRIVAQALSAFNYDRTLALRLSERALRKDPGNTLASNVLNDVLASSWKFPFYQEAIRIKGVEIDRISDLDISKYNRYLLAGSLDGHIYLRDLTADDTLAELAALGENERHRQEITDVDFVGKFPGDDFYFLTSSRDSTARLWQIDTNTQAKTCFTYKHGEPLSAVYMGFSRQDTFVVTAGDRHILLWDYCNPEFAADSFPAPHTAAFEFIENGYGRMLIAAGQDSMLRFFNIDNPGDTLSFLISEGDITAMDFAGDKLAAGLANGHLIIWEINESFFRSSAPRLEVKAAGKAHSETIKDLVFLKNGGQILTSSADKSAKLWDAEVNLLKTFLGHNDGVQTVATSDDERFVYTGGEDKTIKKWDLKLSVYTPNTIPGLDGKVKSVDFMPEEQKLLIHTRNQKLGIYEKDNWEKYTLQQEVPFENPAAITDLAVSSDGRRILAAMAGAAEAELRHVNGDKLKSLKHCEKGVVSGAAFSRDGKFILTTGGTITCVWEEGNISAPYRTLEHEHPVGQAVVAEDKNGAPVILTSARGNSKAYLWSGNKTDTINHTDEVLSVAFSPDARYFLTGSQDNSFVIGEVARPREARRVQRHEADVRCVAFSGGEKGSARFLTADEEGVVRLWALDGGEFKEQKCIINHGAPITEAFFLSETRILTLGTGGQVKIWDTGQMESFVGNDIYQVEKDEEAL
ncbi:MAG: hypothetical protein KDD10_10330 [Phaeodactylibacter sp.]|nr:hypothetical protein [Phaeodactylibacter sp.]